MLSLKIEIARFISVSVHFSQMLTAQLVGTMLVFFYKRHMKGFSPFGQFDSFDEDNRIDNGHFLWARDWLEIRGYHLRRLS